MGSHKKIATSWRRKMVAAGTLAVSAALGARAVAMTEPVYPGEAKDAAAESQEPVKQFDIPSGPLEQALDTFRTQSEVNLKIRLSHNDMAGFQTKGVRGLYSASTALRLMLEGTGLSFQFNTPTNVEVLLRAREQVDVSAAPNSIALSQFTQPLTDTAQTVNVIPQFIMQEQHANTLKETLRNIPGISLAAGEGGSQGDNLTIRGFSARNDMFLDGIRDFGSYYRDAFDYESVSVIQGPASVEFGRGSTGGVVNQESKMPLPDRMDRAGMQFGTNMNRRIEADINEPLNDYIEGAALRVNLVGMDTKVAGRDFAETRRFGIAPSLTLGLNSRTRWNVSYLHEAENSMPDYGLPYFYNSVAKVNRHNFYGFADDNWLKTAPDVVTGRVDHDFNENFSVRSILRWGNYPRDIRVTEPQITTAATLVGSGANTGTSQYPVYANYTATCANTSACYLANTPLSSVTVLRNQIQAKSVEDILWEQTTFTGHFKVKGIENDAIILIEGGRERSSPIRPKYTVANESALNPDGNGLFVPLTISAPSVTHVASQSYGFNFLDTLKLTWWLQLSGGIRFDYFNTHSDALSYTASKTTTPDYSTPSRVVLDHLDKQPTYRAAVVVKPRRNGSVYFDYGTSFNPSAESLSLSANNATMPPEENETYEVGTKWDEFGGKLNLSGAWFRTQKLNAKETDPNNSLNTLNVGTQLVQGVQIGAIGHMSHHMDLIVGYAYLNGKLTASGLNASPYAAANSNMYNAWQQQLLTNPNAQIDPRYNTAPFYFSPVGYPLANVAKNTANLWITHDLGWKFVGGFGTNYVGARRASSAAMIGYYTASSTPVGSVPMLFKAMSGYWNFDAMLRRPISKNLNLQVNVYNLTNGFYIAQPHPNHLIPGEGANAQFSLNARF